MVSSGMASIAPQESGYGAASLIYSGGFRPGSPRIHIYGEGKPGKREIPEHPETG